MSDDSGDSLICIPHDVMERMGWIIGDAVEVQLKANGSVSISNYSEFEPTVDVEVIARAIETFGTSEKAHRWLKKRHLTLGVSPAEYLNAGGEKDDILKILSAISYGGPV
jgi:antitoxin component of MazEF toxin-antitoxin module